MVSWFLGSLVSWFPGFLVSWFLGFLGSWCQRFLASWFQSFLASKFLGFLVSKFLGFEISQLQRFNDPILPNCPFMSFDSYCSHIQDFQDASRRIVGIVRRLSFLTLSICSISKTKNMKSDGMECISRWTDTVQLICNHLEKPLVSKQVCPDNVALGVCKTICLCVLKWKCPNNITITCHI